MVCLAGAVGMEFGAELVAVGMIDLAEYAQRLRPCPVRCGGVTQVVVGVAEVVEGGGLGPAVGEFPAEVQRSLVARDGLLVIAELVMNVAEAVQDGTLPVGCP